MKLENTKRQTIKLSRKLSAKEVSKYGGGFNNRAGRLMVEIRYDDSCGNGHNTFAITGEMKRNGDRDSFLGGCIHNEIVDFFPELKKYIKWHLMKSEGPTHYLENTLYHLSDTDCFGNKKGEPLMAWVTLYTKDGGIIDKICRSLIYRKSRKEFNKLIARMEKDGYHFEVEYSDFSEGKEVNLDGARCSAFWEDMPDSFVELPKIEQKRQLEERLPALLEEFYKDMEELKPEMFGEYVY